jgi:hypothetical protein
MTPPNWLTGSRAGHACRAGAAVEQSSARARRCPVAAVFKHGVDQAAAMRGWEKG